MFALNVAHCATFCKLTKSLGGCLTAIEDDVHVDLMGSKSAKVLLPQLPLMLTSISGRWLFYHQVPGMKNESSLKILVCISMLSRRSKHI